MTKDKLQLALELLDRIELYKRKVDNIMSPDFVTHMVGYIHLRNGALEDAISTETSSKIRKLILEELTQKIEKLEDEFRAL
jgi:hypothetical protein